MKTMQIEGINPFTISQIDWIPGKRIGKHPMWFKLMGKRNPIRNLLGAYEGDFGYFKRAEVRIAGSDGSILLTISCESNREAEDLFNDLNDKLDEFLNLVVTNKNG